MHTNKNGGDAAPVLLAFAALPPNFTGFKTQWGLCLYLFF